MLGIRTFIRNVKSYSWEEVWKPVGGWKAVLDCAVSVRIYGNNVEQYHALEFYRKNSRERKTYFTRRMSMSLSKKMCAGVAPEVRDSIKNKFKFNRFFRPFIHRDYLFAGDADEKAISDFANKHKAFLVKPTKLTRGKGIRKLTVDELSQEVITDLIQKEYLLEEIVVQHPKMAEINASSVNTLRIVTVVDRSGRAHIIGGCLRVGGPGSVVDNFHAGGVAYPLNTDLGVVVGPGRTNQSLDRVWTHPGSNCLMIGFQIPNWHQVTDTVKKAAEMIPEMYYLGWDVAILEDGCELIEANSIPGSNIIQLDHIGKKELIEKFLM